MEIIIYCLPLVLALLGIAALLWLRKEARKQDAPPVVSPGDGDKAPQRGGAGGPKPVK